MVKILVGTANTAKVQAVEKVFSEYFDDVETVAVPVDSSVHVQPLGADIFKGALNRVDALQKEKSSVSADFFVGIEGGLLELHHRWFQADCVCIADNKGATGFGIAPCFELPSSVTAELKQGKELSNVIDQMINRNDTRHIGVINYLSKGRLDKREHLAQGVLMALLPLLNQEIYTKQ